MPEIVFVRTRYKYDSYQDFWRLVELSGFKTCYVDEINLEDDLILISTPLNGEIRPHLANDILKREVQRARLIWWNLERPDSGDLKGRKLELKIRDDNREVLKFMDAVWTSDRWMAQVDPPTVYVTMGSHPDLAGSLDGENRSYDLAHLSYVSARRKPYYEEIRRFFSFAPNAWGEERNRILRSTRAILNVHQTDAPISEPLRIALAAAYKMPYLTEYTRDPYPLEPGVNCLMADLKDLTAAITGSWSQDLSRLGLSLFSRLCVETDFRRSVEAGVKETMELWKDDPVKPAEPLGPAKPTESVEKAE